MPAMLNRLTAQIAVLVLSVSLPLAGLATYLVYNDVLEARARAEATVSDIARHVASDTHAFLGRTEERLRYLAPCLIGATGGGMFGLPGLESLADRPQLSIVDLRAVGADLRVRARLA